MTSCSVRLRQWLLCALVCVYAYATYAKAQPYKILGVFPFPSRSHYAVIDAVVARLAEKGHHVTVYTPFPKREAVPFRRDIDLSGCQLAKFDGPASIDEVASLLSNSLATTLLLTKMTNVSVASVTQCAPFHELLASNDTYDLLITETFTYDAMLLFAQKFSVPFVTFTPNNLFPWHADRMANPSNPSYVPTLVSGYLPPMNFWQRTHNALLYWFSLSAHYVFALSQNDETIKAVLGARQTSSLYDLVRRTSVFFVYTHPSLNAAAPLVPSVVQIAGAHIKPAAALPSDIEKFINESEHGVVYFCMGSLLRGESFPEEKRNAFLHAFSKIQQRVLWKWEGDVLPGKSDKIMISKWMPQRDILAHPKIKLFVSHGGLLGTSEAIYEAVPVLGIPIFGDQRTNVKAIEANGAGELLDYNDISKEVVLEKIQRIVNDPIYKENAKQLSYRYRDRPMSPLDTAVYWTEYVIRHKGAPHLRTAAVDMPWYQYLLFDVIAFVLLVFISVIIFIYYTCKIAVKFIINLWQNQQKIRKTSKKEKKN